jgi:hypothetical protein
METKARIRAVISGALSGLGLGVMGTVLHQTSLAGFPFGAALGLGIVFFYGISLRSVKPRSWAFALSLSALVFMASQELGLDRLVPSNLAGLLWSYGSISLALLVAMFPRIGQRR